MTLQEIHIGDPVAIVGEPGIWRVEAKTRQGILTLECLNADPRIALSDVHEFQVTKAGGFV